LPPRCRDHLARTGHFSAGATRNRGSPLLWLQNRRLHGDAGKYGELEPRITALLNLPARSDAVWEARLAELTGFIAENGKLPTGFQDGRVYNWLRTQRDRCRQGILSAEREATLRTIKGALPKPGGREEAPPEAAATAHMGHGRTANVPTDLKLSLTWR
jgi:hypothetical protein